MTKTKDVITEYSTPIHQKLDQILDLESKTAERLTRVETKLELLPCKEQGIVVEKIDARVEQLELFKQNQTGFVAGVAAIVTLVITIGMWLFGLLKGGN